MTRDQAIDAMIPAYYIRVIDAFASYIKLRAHNGFDLLEATPDGPNS